ncbi:MAG: hypothetical protein HY789_09955 [Deltaproteobacteria bacterium]|nr:hypothetical protein [Deltaproteobacteria bacterium]
MATMTLRGIDDRIANALKEQEKKEGISVNSLTLKLLKEKLGIEKQNRNLLYDDLNHLAGTWSEEQATAFEEVVAGFEKVDEKMWG